MSKNTIELIIKGSVNGVTEAVGTATGALGNLGRSAATALGTLAGNLATAAIQKVGELARAIGETLFNEAPALEQVRKSFENLAAGAGASADEVLASMRDASRGMVSDADLMTSYNEAMLLVGESMATKFPALLEIAQASAAATGQDVGFMLDSLVKGIGRGSPMILDNLGLTINLAEANQKYADSLGISVDQMTKAQQQEALLNATIDAGGDFIARLGDNTSESAMSVAQMKATLENLKNGIAAGLLPVIGALLGPILQLAQDHGPQLIAWAEQAGLWLGENLPRAIEGLQALFSGDITSAISNVGAILGSTFGPETMGTFMTFSDEIKAAWGEVWGFLQEIFGSFVSWFQENLPLIQQTGQTLVDFWQNHVAPTLDNVWAIIKEVVRIGVEFIQTILTTVMQVINGDWAGAWETIKTGAVEIWESIKTIANEFIEGVLNAIGTNLENFKATWSNNWESFKTIVGTVFTNINNAIAEKLAEILTKVQGKLEEVKSFIRNFNLADVGRAMIDGLIEGVLGAAGKLVDAVGGAVQGAIDAAKDLLLMHSPSQVFWDMGENTMLSFANSVKAAAGEPLKAVTTAMGDLTQVSPILGSSMFDQRRYEKHLHVTTVSAAENLAADFALLGVLA